MTPRRRPLRQYKYLTFLSMLFITIFVVCDTTVYRMVYLFGREMPLSGFIIPILFLLGDVLAEAYGYRITMKILTSGIICQCLFGILITLFLLAPSPPNNTINNAYDITFQHIIRVNICSCFSVTCGMLANSFLISKLKIYMNGKRFWLRSLISTASSEIVLCTIAYFIIFTGLKSFTEVIKIIYSVWIYKVIFSTLATPMASYIGKSLKNAENSDVYDIGISYNLLSDKKNEIIELENNYHIHNNDKLLTGLLNKPVNDRQQYQF